MTLTKDVRKITYTQSRILMYNFAFIFISKLYVNFKLQDIENDTTLFTWMSDTNVRKKGASFQIKTSLE